MTDQSSSPAVPDAERLRSIEVLILDCDGVLTNGEITYDQKGNRTLGFYARDGMGLAMLCRAGVRAAVVSGRPTDIAELRHAQLGVGPFLGSVADKAKGVAQVCEELGVEPSACAFMGDDIPDIRGMVACGMAIAVADASPEIIEIADWVTRAPGGRGAVREVCEAILKARGDWDRYIERARSGG